MKQKIGLILLVMSVMTTGMHAQSRNPLNSIPANVKICNSTSSKVLKENIIYKADGTRHQRTVYEYNETGLEASYTDQTWNTTSGQWVDQQKYVNVYNSENICTDKIYMTYGTQGWNNNSKKSLIYKDGVLIEELNYLWNSQNGDWQNEAYSKTIYKYDTQGFTIEFTDQLIDASSGEWKEPHSKMTYTHNPAGQITEEILQYWDNEKQEWINKVKDVFEYDAIIHKTNIFVYEWENDQWTAHSKQILSYDNEGKLERAEYYKSFEDSSLDAYNVYTYTEGPISGETGLTDIDAVTMSVYPNPATTNINLQITIAYLNKTAGLYDTAGRLIKEILLKNEVTNIDISELPASIYFIKVGDQTKKVIKR